MNEAYTLRLFQVTLGTNNDEARIESLKKWDGATINYSHDSIEIKTIQNLTLEFSLSFDKKDSFSETFLGQFENGESFRFVQPIDFSLNMLQLQNQVENMLGISGLNPDSWAVHFYVLKLGDERTFDLVVKGGIDGSVALIFGVY